MKKFELILTRSLILTLLALLTNTFLMAQSRLSGTGDEESPYVISSQADWTTFANDATYWDLNVYTRLDTNITTDEMVGNSTDKYEGHFDGNGHTLTFNKGTQQDPFNSDHCAPFRYILNANIKNLTVTGTIYTKKKNAGGFVGQANGIANSITNCRSNITIDCTSNNVNNNDGTHGGFVGESPTSAVISFKDCIFDGKIKDTNTTRKVQKCGGFAGWVNKTVNYDNCYMAGTIEIKQNISHFNRNKSAAGNRIDMYYLKDQQNDVSPGPKGNPASQSYDDTIAKKYTIDGIDYYVPVTIKTWDIIDEPAEPYNVDTLVQFFGKTILRKGNDYSLDIEYKETIDGEYEDIDEVLRAGFYKITIVGNDRRGYLGTESFEFRVLSEDEKWSKLEAALAGTDPTVTLSRDFMATSTDNVLIVNRDVTINLNGHTIDRHLAEAVANGQVLRIEAGCTVTINGPGTITGGFNLGTKENIDGGGIHNMGTLILNNVTITDNHCIKWSGTTFSGRGGGIYTGKGSSLTMNGGLISNNTARGGGGGVFTEEAALFSLNGVTIDDNESESKGGGVRILALDKDPATAVMTDCIISNNRATDVGSDRASEGGGVYMQKGRLSMTRCEITKNRSSFAGAGFFSLDGKTYATDCIITGNSAFVETDKMYGGGISLYKNSTYTMDGGTIEGNSSFQDGGGIYVMQGAKFNILGQVVIRDNFRIREGVSTTENNAYLGGSSVINIIGPITEGSEIYITGHGLGGIYTKGLKSEYVQYFKSDDKYQTEVDPSTGEFRLVPYDWENPGAWFDQEWWDESNPRVPTADDDVVIKRAIMIPEGYTAYAKSVDFTNGTVVIKEGGELIITDHESSAQVDLLFQKNITKIPDGDLYGWHIVSIPIDNAELNNDYVYNTNIITRKTKPFDFDLLRYDEPTHYWDSYNDNSVSFSTSFTNLVKGCGYLYRNEKDVSIEFYGTMNVVDVDCNVTYTGSAAPLSGFNLLGNPYTEKISILNTTLLGKNDVVLGQQLTGFYKLEKGQKWTALISDPNEKFDLGEGFLVQVPEQANKVRFSKTARTSSSKAERKSIMFSVSNSKDEDRAYAIWDDCLGLNKISHINEDLPMLYINQKGDDYAIAPIGKDVNEFNLNLKATTTGQYTLNVKLEGGFNYLHLIDRLAQKDIDLLVEKEYTFIGSPADSEGRFIVRLGISNDDVFAYQSGNDIVVSGEGELQVYDVTGRMVMNTTINGVQTVSIPSNGVYIFKLNEMVQKIVVR